MSPPRDEDPPSDDGSEGAERRATDADDRPDTEPAADGRQTDAPANEPDGRPGDRPPQRQSPQTRGSRTGEGSAGPPPRRATDEEKAHWLWTVAVDVGSSALAVLLVGFFLFTVSGVWPPMVAVESASMTPHMKTGDLVFVMEEERFPGEAAHGDTGVVTAQVGATSDYEKFSEPGDVIVYEPDGDGGETPIIHRAMFWVEKGERWYDRADESAVAGADSCEEMANCPAPHAGFITKGDANGAYDQVGPNPHSGPVKPAWIVGTAEARVPGLGCIRLRSQDCSIGLSTAPGVGLGVPAVGYHVDPTAAFGLIDGLELEVPDATFASGLV